MANCARCVTVVEVVGEHVGLTTYFVLYTVYVTCSSVTGSGFLKYWIQRQTEIVGTTTMMVIE
jgi:hypothetical protein